VVGAYLRRGLAAGLLAGLLAGLFGLAVGEPSLDTAITLEERAAIPAHDGDSPVEVPRGLQKAGLVAGSGLLGLAAGALFGVAAAWAVGRVDGDDWARSLKLGAAAVGALVILPALKYPPNPPGVGDPATVGTRTLLFLGLGAVGLLLVAGGWSLARQLRASRLDRPTRALAVAGALGLAGAGVLAVLPSVAAVGGVPGELLWTFRLGALGSQLVLYGGTAVLFGLLSARAGRTSGALR
jgi:hypothetical protein